MTQTALDWLYGTRLTFENWSPFAGFGFEHDALLSAPLAKQKHKRRCRNTKAMPFTTSDAKMMGCAVLFCVIAKLLSRLDAMTFAFTVAGCTVCAFIYRPLTDLARFAISERSEKCIPIS